MGVGHHALVDVSRARERGLDVRHDVVGADVLDELGLVQERAPAAGGRRTGSACGPDFFSRSLSVSSACSPVASMAVMLRSRRMTIGANADRSAVASASLSVIPNRNGPWMRRMVT